MKHTYTRSFVVYLFMLCVSNAHGMDIKPFSDATRQLHDTAEKKGNVTGAITYLLEKKADLSAPDQRYGRTPLHLAVAAGNTQSVRCLLEHKASPNVKDADCQTPMETACRQDDYAMLETLINYGKEDPQKTNFYPVEYLSHMSPENQENARVLLGEPTQEQIEWNWLSSEAQKKKRNKLQKTQAQLNTQLWETIAVEGKETPEQIQKVKTLLVQNADPNYSKVCLTSLLLSTVFNNNITITQQLLEHNAHVHFKQFLGLEILYFIPNMSENRAMVKLLLKHKRKQTKQ